MKQSKAAWRGLLNRSRIRRVAIFLAVILMLTSLPGNVQKQSNINLEAAAAVNLQNPRVTSYSAIKFGQKVTWDYVWFGTYPQTEIVDEPKTSGTYTLSFGEKTDYIVDADTYSKLKAATDWDDRGNITLDGVQYRRIDRSKVYYPGNSTVKAFTWDDDYHYFRYEPIKWRVLNVKDGKAFLLSDLILDEERYHSADKATWQMSDIRSWLNGYGKTDYSDNNFYETAFNPSERDSICLTGLDNNKKTDPFASSADSKTKDKVFLLAIDDVCDNDRAVSFGFSRFPDDTDKSRHAKCSAYAKARGCYTGMRTTSGIRKKGDYLLRTVTKNKDSRMTVAFEGSACQFEGYSNEMFWQDGVRPAICLDLSSGQWSYAGTKSISRSVFTDYNYTYGAYSDFIKVKSSQLSTKSKKFKCFYIKDIKSKVTFKVVGGNKASRKALKLNRKTGQVTVKKGTKKGEYTLRVKVTVNASKKNNKGSKTVKIFVLVQ